MGSLIELMEAAGFADIEYRGETGVATSRTTVGGSFRARRPE